ncbi:MAG TPA: NAD(P)(+) transhydrogenase (Re/Si-specific) subunit beta [Gemmatimonadaceae bacterium]|nr:NAD(P)(+) transhydrogenase (Re/Si-specific) subunit beta [Gemmatimonadaceae bacterium]
MPESVVQLGYLVAAVCFILGLKWLNHPLTARSGNRLSAVGMLIAIVLTLLDRAILSYGTIAAGLLVGGALGLWLARTVKMTAMPQMVALLNGFGGAASLIVGGAELLRAELLGQTLAPEAAVTIQLAVFIGAVTFTGSLVAYAKLQELITGRALLFPGMRALTVLAVVATLALAAYQVLTPEPLLWPFYAVVGLSLALGVLLVIPIGGADMPVVISLLTADTGIAAAMTGFAIGNTVLIVSGALVGSSGIILSQIMCRAMNRSLANVLFGAFGAQAGVGGGRSAEGLTVRSVTAEDAALQLAYARSVVVVPGYGLAVAQAQQQVRELAELIERRGGEVKYAIHPVAGRMPGHMSVLLSEAQVEYDALITDVDEANQQVERADVVLVVGANDIVNPAAVRDPSSAIAGMPVVEAWRAKTVFVLKRGMGSGYAGIDNELFYEPNTQMLFGDAKKSLSTLIAEVKGV